MSRIQRQESTIPKRLRPVEALTRIYRFCAYQERSHQEVKNKLTSYGLNEADADEVLARLIIEGFVNEERFARTFAGGKFRMKKWGRLKIEHGLRGAGVSQKCILIGLGEIEDEAYRETLRHLLKKRSINMRETGVFQKRNTLARFVIGKGYEPELVWEMVKDILPD